MPAVTKKDEPQITHSHLTTGFDGFDVVCTKLCYQLAEDGLSYSAIAEFTDISYDSVKRIANELLSSIQ